MHLFEVIHAVMVKGNTTKEVNTSLMCTESAFTVFNNVSFTDRKE